MTRHELRYKAMTILYQANLYESNGIEFNINDIISSQLEESNKFVTSLVTGVIENKQEIDEVANSHLADWEITRLGFTDQAILRMAIYEILHTDTPDVTCIDEAIELAKEYSDDKVVKMINVREKIKSEIISAVMECQFEDILVDIISNGLAEGRGGRFAPDCTNGLRRLAKTSG